MLPRIAKFVSGVALLLLPLLISAPVRAQTASTLSGTVTGPSGTAVSNAKVSVKNLATGQSTEAKTDSAGLYNLPNLLPGEYEVSISAEGVGSKTARVMLPAGVAQKLDVALAAGTEPSLGDLGFTPDQLKGNAQDQARLDKRSHMLKIHQRLGLITLAPLVATLITSNQAAGRKSTASGRELHAALGGVTTGLYLTTASFAVFAPKISGTPTRGPIRVHKALAWVHGAGMILTPILGTLAYNQRNRGEKVHGIASAHGAVAATTGIAYGLAVLSVSIKF
jgi:hypothetical protein